jgi:hypothetical protein
MPTAYRLLLTAYCLLLAASCGNNQQQQAAQPDDWCELTVFAHLPAEIDTIRVIHKAEAPASFELVQEQDTVWAIRPLVEQSFNNLNYNLLNRYLLYYAQVYADNTLAPDNKEFRAIVHQEDWQYSIHIAGSRKPNRTVQIYGIPAAEGEGEDTDKCLIYIVETKEIAYASWVSFDILLKKFQDFIEKK